MKHSVFHTKKRTPNVEKNESSTNKKMCYINALKPIQKRSLESSRKLNQKRTHPGYSKWAIYVPQNVCFYVPQNVSFYVPQSVAFYVPQSRYFMCPRGVYFMCPGAHILTF